MRKACCLWIACRVVSLINWIIVSVDAEKPLGDQNSGATLSDVILALTSTPQGADQSHKTMNGIASTNWTAFAQANVNRTIILKVGMDDMNMELYLSGRKYNFPFSSPIASQSSAGSILWNKTHPWEQNNMYPHVSRTTR